MQEEAVVPSPHVPTAIIVEVGASASNVTDGQLAIMVKPWSATVGTGDTIECRAVHLNDGNSVDWIRIENPADTTEWPFEPAPPDCAYTGAPPTSIQRW